VSPDATSTFPFVQLDVPGRVGLADGRYLMRASDEAPSEHVLVVQTLGAPAPTSRRLRRGTRARPAEAGNAPELPLTRLTAVRAEPLGEEPAVWLAAVRQDAEALDGAIADAIAAVNRAIHTHRAATADPYVAELAAAGASAIRVGYGTGDEVADGRWREAADVSLDDPRRRAEALRPQERVAGVLAGREAIDPCETLLLRARADLDGRRPREAALQLRAGLEALLAEVKAEDGSDQQGDLADLEARLPGVRAAADTALREGLTEAREAEVRDALAICERVLRRRRILPQPN
jgi:hypothetical protein